MDSTATSPLPVRLVYGVYAWLVLVAITLPVALGCVVLPGLGRRRALARAGAATVLRLIGSRAEVRGSLALAGDASVVVANHQSYLDGIILCAVLPPRFTFLIKREMVRVPVAGFLLARIGSEFVDRGDTDQRKNSARRLVQAARRGQALAVFPEGTFDGRPGLKPFLPGAFRTARIARLPVVPVVIRGARRKLPDSAWLPRPGPLTVDICDPIRPETHGDEISLMQATRAAILERLGEPDLDEPDTAGTPSGLKGPNISDRSPLPAESTGYFRPDP